MFSNQIERALELQYRTFVPLAGVASAGLNLPRSLWDFALINTPQGALAIRLADSR